MKRSAFTLLELLVIAAIVALLSALVASGVAHGKMAAQRVACMNNLKPWGYATHLYADEQEDILPRESAVDGINTWEMTGSSTSPSTSAISSRSLNEKLEMTVSIG